MKVSKSKTQREENQKQRKIISRNIGIVASFIFIISTIQNILNIYFVEYSRIINTVSVILAIIIFSVCMLMDANKIICNKENLESVIEYATLMSIIAYIITNTLLVSSDKCDRRMGLYLLAGLVIVTIGYAIWIFKFKKDRKYHTE